MAKNKKKESFTENLIETTNDILDTDDNTSDYKSGDIKKNKGMALLAYIFVPIPLFFEKKSKFVKYHVAQGFNLFICYLLFAFFGGLVSRLGRYEVKCVRNGFIYSCGKYDVHWIIKLPLVIIGLILTAISIAGIINVINGKAKQLPVIGRINVLKKLYPKI